MTKRMKKTIWYVAASIVLYTVAIYTASNIVKYDDDQITFKHVTVHEGDTVWKLIDDNNGRVDMNYMYYLYKNHGGKNVIHSGDVIEIPVKVK